MFKFTTKQFASLAVFLLATAASSPSVLVSAQIGGETDDNGCLIGAGESFCETTQSCIGPNDTCPLPGGDTDANGCKPSAGERFCETTNSCIGPTDECPEPSAACHNTAGLYLATAAAAVAAVAL